ncbi:unnamed protein product [Symbiodinium sp. CCMP2592]|nr:unnamed protein product [Symbiodinium sp. CCMP2592]
MEHTGLWLWYDRAREVVITDMQQRFDDAVVVVVLVVPLLEIASLKAPAANFWGCLRLEIYRLHVPADLHALRALEMPPLLHPLLPDAPRPGLFSEWGLGPAALKQLHGIHCLEVPQELCELNSPHAISMTIAIAAIVDEVALPDTDDPQAELSPGPVVWAVSRVDVEVAQSLRWLVSDKRNIFEAHSFESEAVPPRCAAMSQQSKAKYFFQLTEVPAGWPLTTVIDAFVHLGAYHPEYHADANPAREAVSRRLVELWASQPEEAEAWLERFGELNMATRQERLREALRQHGAAAWGKYFGNWHFSEAGLLRGELRPAAAREAAAARYLQNSYSRDRCRELAERLVAAESLETARKRQKLEEETSERRRLEAELQTSQEEGRELRNRLAAAEAQVSSKDAELQTAQSESADFKEQREELAARTAAAESAVTEMQQELRQLREEHGKCQERYEEIANRLEAEAAEHATTKERLSQAEADAAERRLDLQRLQEESRGYQERCQQAEAARWVLSESKVELQLENARLQERCEQLQQQLAKAEGQMHVLREEKATYKERCRQLECGATSPRTPYASLIQQGPTPSGDAASSGQESNLTEELGYVLVEDGVASSSAWSCSSWFSVRPDCFMPDAIFKTRTDGRDHFLKGRDLLKGSQVVAGDGETMVEVCEKPVWSQARGFVRLQAGAAMLEVTAEHPVQVPPADDAMDDEEGGGSARYVEAGQLKEGDLVMLHAGEPGVLTNVEVESGDCEVLKLAFKPNLPVAVFSCPPCILSKGANRKPATRRGKKCRQEKQVPQAAAVAASAHHAEDEVCDGVIWRTQAVFCKLDYFFEGLENGELGLMHEDTFAPTMAAAVQLQVCNAPSDMEDRGAMKSREEEAGKHEHAKIHRDGPMPTEEMLAASKFRGGWRLRGCGSAKRDEEAPDCRAPRRSPFFRDELCRFARNGCAGSTDCSN